MAFAHGVRLERLWMASCLWVLVVLGVANAGLVIALTREVFGG